MEEELELYLDEAKDSMNKAIKHLESEVSKVRAGRAYPQMVDGITVDYYGVPTAISKVANLSTPDQRTLTIQPWQKNMLEAIEKAILKANIGITPFNNGEVIHLNVPPLTEERRRQLVKQVKTLSETSKVSVRNIRRDTNEEVKRLKKEGLAEDKMKAAEELVQRLTDEAIVRIEKIVEVKEAEIMKV